MIRRAIILVPGLAKREQLSVRNRLVTALEAEAQEWIVQRKDAEETDDTDAVLLTARPRSRPSEADDGTITLAVYEAYWGDLIPEWSGEAIWTRFARASSMMMYWGFGGLAGALVRRETPERMTGAILLAALLLFVWYLSVLAVLVRTVAESGLPVLDWLAPGSTAAQEAAQAAADKVQNAGKGLAGWAEMLSARAQQAAQWLVGTSLYMVVAGLVGLTWLERLANAADFSKAYLQNLPLGEDDTGVRTKARNRLLSVLDQVNAQDGPAAYDEVYVVGHSLGAAIAVDTLAEYGDPLQKTTLFTWGSPLGPLVMQDNWVEGEVRKLYDGDPGLRSWIDVAFSIDYLGSRVPVPRIDPQTGRNRMDRRFPETVEPPVPNGISRWSHRLHDSYISTSEVVMMLVEPAEKLPTYTPPRGV